MSDLLFEKRPDRVAVITLNRPERLNALSAEMFDRLKAALRSCADDDDVGCVVLTGTGRAFCAGGDVKGMAERAGPAVSAPKPASPISEAQRGAVYHRDNHLGTSYALHAIPKPTIAMVNGVAAGGGFSLAAACDLRIASDQARFTTAFRNVAVGGDYGLTFFLPRLVGSGKARELFFTADIVDAQTALQLGIVNRVVPHEQLEEETLTLAARFAAGPPVAYALMKENLNLAEKGDLRALLDQEAMYFQLASRTEDHREAARAFVERRPPAFTGT